MFDGAAEAEPCCHRDVAGGLRRQVGEVEDDQAEASTFEQQVCCAQDLLETVLEGAWLGAVENPRFSRKRRARNVESEDAYAAVCFAKSTVTVSGATAPPVLLTGLKVMVICFDVTDTRRYPELCWSCLSRTRFVPGNTVLLSRYFTFVLSPGSGVVLPKLELTSGDTLWPLSPQMMNGTE